MPIPEPPKVFAKKDKVQLLSGGPVMVVLQSITPDYVRGLPPEVQEKMAHLVNTTKCIWFNSSLEITSDFIDNDLLTPAK